MLIPFRAAHVHHASSAHGTSRRWLASRCPTFGGPPVNSDNAKLHRRRQRRATPPGRDAVRSQMVSKRRLGMSAAQVAAKDAAALRHAVELVYRTCCLAGAPKLIGVGLDGA